MNIHCHKYPVLLSIGLFFQILVIYRQVRNVLSIVSTKYSLSLAYCFDIVYETGNLLEKKPVMG